MTTTPAEVTKKSRNSTIVGVSATPSLRLKAVAATKSITSDKQLGHLVADVGDDLVVDPATDLDRVHERAEVVVGEDHPGRLLGDLAARAHRHADVGLLQRRGVVDRVAGHRHDQPLLLHEPGQAELVLRGDPAEHVQLGEPALDLLVGHRLQLAAADRARAEPERLADGVGGDGVVAGDHADVDAGAQRHLHGVPGLGAQRVDHAHHADEAEVGRQRHRVVGHGLQLVVLDEAGREGEHPQALLGQPLVGGVDVGPGLLDRHLRVGHRAAGPAAAGQHHVGSALDQLDDPFAVRRRAPGGRWP